MPTTKEYSESESKFYDLFYDKDFIKRYFSQNNTNNDMFKMYIDESNSGKHIRKIRKK